jgi:hypothetical protein
VRLRASTPALPATLLATLFATQAFALAVVQGSLNRETDQQDREDARTNGPDGHAGADRVQHPLTATVHACSARR